MQVIDLSFSFLLVHGKVSGCDPSVTVEVRVFPSGVAAAVPVNVAVYVNVLSIVGTQTEENVTPVTVRSPKFLKKVYTY